MHFKHCRAETKDAPAMSVEPRLPVPDGVRRARAIDIRAPLAGPGGGPQRTPAAASASGV